MSLVPYSISDESDNDDKNEGEGLVILHDNSKEEKNDPLADKESTISSIKLNNMNMKIKRKTKADKEEKKLKKSKIVMQNDNKKDEVNPTPSESKQVAHKKSTKSSFSSLLPKPQYSDYDVCNEESSKDQQENNEDSKLAKFIPAKPVIQLYQSDRSTNKNMEYYYNYQNNEDEEESILPMPKTNITVEESHDSHIEMYPGPKSNLPDQSRLKYLDKKMRNDIQSEYMLHDVSQNQLTDFKYDVSKANGTICGTNSIFQGTGYNSAELSMSKLGKRKSQITFLASQANQARDSIREQKNNYGQMKRQTRQRYGW